VCVPGTATAERSSPPAVGFGLLGIVLIFYFIGNILCPSNYSLQLNNEQSVCIAANLVSWFSFYCRQSFCPAATVIGRLNTDISSSDRQAKLFLLCARKISPAIGTRTGEAERTAARQKEPLNSGSANEENIRKGIARLGKVLKKFLQPI
jgi:hypothetical protein